MNEENTFVSILYEDPSPYPSVEVERPNADYADLLFQDYAGRVSEFTQVNQYSYHYIVNCMESECIVRHLRRIGEVERHHMELLGELILLLGNYPTYQIGAEYKLPFWSGKYICYGRNLQEQLKADLEAEYLSIRNYNMHCKMIEDKNIVTMLQRIIKDEYIHIEVLQALIRGEC